MNAAPTEDHYREAKRDKDALPARQFRAERRAYAQHWLEVQMDELNHGGVGQADLAPNRVFADRHERSLRLR